MASMEERNLYNVMSCNFILFQGSCKEKHISMLSYNSKRKKQTTKFICIEILVNSVENEIICK